VVAAAEIAEERRDAGDDVVRVITPGLTARLRRSELLTFRTSITAAVLAFVTMLGAALIAIQSWSFHLAAKEAAATRMDMASAETLGRLKSDIREVETIVHVLSTAPSISDSDERSEAGPAIPLFKVALRELPQMDSIYVGYDNGGFLQVRPLGLLRDSQREKLQAPADAVYAISLIRPMPEGVAPMRRVFQDRDGKEIARRDLPTYGFDPRERPWYANARRGRHVQLSLPYVAFSTGTPVITLSMAFEGKVRGVAGADLKLDDFSDFVNSHRPGEHGLAMVFDESGVVIAHPDLARIGVTPNSEVELPRVGDVGGLAALVLRARSRSGADEGRVTDAAGDAYLYRLSKIAVTDEANLNLLMIAREDDFAKNVRALEKLGTGLALLAGFAFVPLAWFFGSRMSSALVGITKSAARLRRLETSKDVPVRSRIKELRELGLTMSLAQHAIGSFSRFVPKELVRRVLDNSVSTELGGARQETTILFSDVQGFTTIAETSDPDALMRQTSRYFSVLTEAFLAEDGTIDKFIGDAVMVFWNAPNAQPDHVERACRAALAAKAASEKLNREFETEGLRPFITRFGMHVGDAVIGNVGSSERMDYTALGNTVNLASRLEGLNKEYGTSILVIGEIRGRAWARFRFREVGTAIAKGMSSQTEIYELVESLAQSDVPALQGD
jgi:adenylate cyclase